ncbi:hypothetical protein LTR17_009551 [Elasticomyces elasticus]|nr:hypothetical protein LTR17_009551 [Elasticomyces elasticus]
MAAKRVSSDSDGDQPALKRFKSNYLDVMTILADSDETPFVVHTDVLCKKSSFFKAACSKNWESGKQGTIKLPTIEPGTMKSYIHWLYTSQVDLDWVSPAGTPEPVLTPKPSATFALFKLYVAADMFLNVTLKNAVTDLLVDRVKASTFRGTSSTYTYVWENTSPEASLRKLILDYTASRTGSTSLKESGQDLSQEFLHSLSVRLLALLKKDQAVRGILAQEKSEYHERMGEESE